jgi:aldose 1-epimerase
MTVTETVFGTGPAGEDIRRYEVANSHGYSMACMDFGATLISFQAPDRSGVATEITLGYDDLSTYLAGHPYFGSTIGRVANRIGGASFELDGRTYALEANEAPNTLHSGTGGFHTRVWRGQTFQSETAAGVLFSYLSSDGEQGFPGNLDVTVSMSLTEQNELILEYRAETDVPTPVNLTNHTYWNLAGAPDLVAADSGRAATAGHGVRAAGGQEGGAIGAHVLTIPGETRIVVDDASIPTGELRAVADTPYDFLRPKPIGRDIAGVSPGYDSPYVLGEADGKERVAAIVSEPESGRRMEIVTTCPAVQFYSGCFLSGRAARGGKQYRLSDAFCLETQFHPDAVNHPNFPSIILRPGTVYQHRTIHRFSTA